MLDGQVEERPEVGDRVRVQRGDYDVLLAEHDTGSGRLRGKLSGAARGNGAEHDPVTDGLTC